MICYSEIPEVGKSVHLVTFGNNTISANSAEMRDGSINVALSQTANGAPMKYEDAEIMLKFKDENSLANFIRFLQWTLDDIS